MGSAAAKYDTSIASSNLTDEHMRQLFRHEKRPAWGLAIVVWDKPQKRAYQFEDGKVRIFKRGFYNLFEHVEPPENEARQLIKVLERRSEAAAERREKRRKRARKGTKRKPIKTRPFSEQTLIFSKLYPKHFSDPAWTKGIRGEGARKRLKRHRDPAIEEFQQLLSKENLDKYIDAQRCRDFVEELFDAIRRTNLVTKKQSEPMGKLEKLQQRAYVVALRDLLWDDDETQFVRRFEKLNVALRSGLGKAPAWQLLTAPMALVKPQEFFHVHPNTIRKQGATFDTYLEKRREPTAVMYKKMVEVAQRTRKELEEHGAEPRDLLDVRDFMWATLRPAADKVLAKDDE